MKDSIMCCAFCLGLGMVVGGVIVSNNSKLRNWLKNMSAQVQEAYTNVKDAAVEKVDELKKNSACSQKDNCDTK